MTKTSSYPWRQKPRSTEGKLVIRSAAGSLPSPYNLPLSTGPYLTLCLGSGSGPSHRGRTQENHQGPRVCPFSLETVHDLTERLLPGLSQRLRISGSPGIPAQSLPTEPMVMSRPGIWESWWSSHSPLLASLPDSIPTPGRVLGRR